MPFTTNEQHHFHFFANKEMTSLYITLGLFGFAGGLISIFVPIYFWQLGFPFWKIIFFYFLMSVSFVIWSFLLMPALRKLSDKMMMFLSIPFRVLYFLGLGFIGTVPILFFILPAVVTLNALFFNVGYHLDFAKVADKDHIGAEVGSRFMVSSLFGLAAPFLGGLLIGFVGFQNTFFIATFILLLAVLPLFFFPHRHVSSHLTARAVLGFLTDKSLRPFNLSSVGYAAEKVVYLIIWPIFIFLTIGGIEKFGAVVSGGLVGAAIITYFIGFLADAGRRRKMLKWMTWLLSLIWLTRPLLRGAFPIVASHVGGNLAGSALMVSWSSQYYKIAKAIHVPGVFIMSREVLYALTRIIFLPILMLLSYLFTQGQFFTISFVLAAISALFLLFANRQYLRNLDEFIVDGEER